MKSKRFIWLSIACNLFLIIGITILAIQYANENYYSVQSDITKTNQNIIDFQWPADKKMALSITFDDATISQIDSGIPILDKYGVKATFYVTLPNLEKRIDAWRKVINNGHEIGNHTTKHPCSLNYDGDHNNSLEYHTIIRMRNDLNVENIIIKNILGVNPVSFAYPCGQTFIGEGLNTKSYVPLVSEMFESGRLFADGSVNPVFSDMAQLPSEHLDDRSFDQIKGLIENARKTGKWLILTGHNIGTVQSLCHGYLTSPEYLTSSKSTIEAICKYAIDPKNGIWIDNVHNIASYIKGKRGEKQFVKVFINKNPISFFYSKLWSIYYISKMKLSNYKYIIQKKWCKF